MKKVIDYWILWHVNRQDLSDEILKYISEGWNLYGFPYISFITAKNEKNEPESFNCHYQAMVKYSEDENV